MMKDAEREELKQTRAFLRRVATNGGAIVSSAAMTLEQIAIARAAERLFVMPDGCGFVYKPGKPGEEER